MIVVASAQRVVARPHRRPGVARSTFRQVPLTVCMASPHRYGCVPLSLSDPAVTAGATRTVQYSKLLAVTTPT